MRAAINKSLIRFTTMLVVLAALAVPAAAQSVQTSPGRLRLDSLERLAPKAAQTVNIEIDGFLIRFAGALLSDSDPQEQAVKELLAGLKGVYVKNYEFKLAGQFSAAEVAPVREQLRGPVWTRILDVKSRKVDLDDAELYVATADGRVEGLAILVVEPRELTVINIVGSIDLDKLKKLEETLKLPGIRIKRRKSTED